MDEIPVDVQIRMEALRAISKIIAAEAGGRGSTGNDWQRRARDMETWLRTGR